MVDRQIGDRRGRNQIEAYLPGVSRSLPTGPSLSVLEVIPSRQRLSICLTDRKDVYHQFQISASRAESNALWPPLKLKDLAGTKAYEQFINSHYAGKKKAPREAVGDFLGGPTVSSGGKLPEEVHACFNSVIQGDHLGVEIATQSHRNMLKSRGLLCSEEEITSTLPFGGGPCLQGLIIDDFFSVSVEDAVGGNAPSLAEKRFRKAKQAYREEGLLGSDEKDVVNQEVAKVAGAELDSSAFTRKLGLCTWLLRPNVLVWPFYHFSLPLAVQLLTPFMPASSAVGLLASCTAVLLWLFSTGSIPSRTCQL